MRERTDVIVAGGGSAGLAAAIASARAGARTLLVERAGMLGGMATSALVHSICGLYTIRQEPKAEMAHPGFPREFAQRLLDAGGAEGPLRFGRVDLLLTRPPIFAALADALCAAEPNLEVALCTEVAAAHRAANGELKGELKAVDLWSRGSQWRVEARAFIDTTGDAALATAAGAPTEQAATLQRPAFIFTLGGADTTSLHGDGRLKLAQRLVGGVRAGGLSPGLLGAQLRPSAEKGEVSITIDLGDADGSPFDPFCPRSLSAYHRFGRALALELAAFLRQECPSFSASFIAALPAQIGIRESRRLVGRARLEADDILHGTAFPDAVARSTWPIEMRETATGPRLRYPTGAHPCEIPLRALMACDLPNLFTAGRCLSSSHEAQAALRVIGTCLATGEAAGLAAALYTGNPTLFTPAMPEAAAAAIRTRRSELSQTTP